VPSPEWTLNKHPDIIAPPGPVCLVIMDGVGLGKPDEGNAWHLAHTPFLDGLMKGPVVGRVAAHGVAVGMPTNSDMGNSEVGHNALGAGRVFDQGAKLVQNAVADGSLFKGDTWKWVMEAVTPADGGTLHLIGLWSDGNVHSHIAHAYAIMDNAVSEGVRRIRIHPLLDGRDVGETSALEYIEPLEAQLAKMRDAGVDARVASGGGRMVTTMDRYEADWAVVERGWEAHVHGKGRGFASASAAIAQYRDELPDIIDQYMQPFVVVDDDGKPVGPIRDGDAVIFFNFRGDRALEITRAFEAPEGDFPHFDRGPVPKVRYAGMMEYDGDLKVPQRYLVEPPQIDRTLGQYLAKQGVRQLAISETQKFGHVTYFFNGNNSEPFGGNDLERWVEIPSDRVEFDQRPWMKAADITDRTLAEIDAFNPGFVRLNYANGDMVGHTGNVRAARIAMESLDLSLSRLVKGIVARKGLLLITADHGNCEAMIERDKKTGALKRNEDGEFITRTNHTRNPVPVVAVGHGADRLLWNHGVDGAGLANLTATTLSLLGYRAPGDYEGELLHAK